MKAQPMLAALALSLYANLKDKLFLENIAQTIEAIQDPDRSFGRWAGQQAGNYVPYSSLLHHIVTPSTGIPGVATPDAVMREADTFVSAALSKLPGFSTDFHLAEIGPASPSPSTRASGPTSPAQQPTMR